MRKRAMVVLCLAAVAVLPSCSSSSGDSTLAGIEQDVGLLMQVMNYLIGELDPFASPTPLANTAGGSLCTDVSAGNCNVDGSVEQCPTAGSDIDVVFNACAADVPAIPGTIPEPFSFEISGTLTYSPLEVWPSGSRTLIYTPQGEDWSYAMTFDGTASVAVFVEDLINGTQADCVGDLETFAADCSLVE